MLQAKIEMRTYLVEILILCVSICPLRLEKVEANVPGKMGVHSFLSTDRAAITRKTAPAHHKLSVKNQTAKATRAAGIKANASLITKIITNPMITNPMKPKRSYSSKLNRQLEFAVMQQ